jgi:hypothetical protein
VQTSVDPVLMIERVSPTFPVIVVGVTPLVRSQSTLMDEGEAGAAEAEPVPLIVASRTAKMLIAAARPRSMQ